MNNLFTSVRDYIREDWNENPTRCVLEIIAWFMSFGTALLMAFTIPNPPFLIIYPLFIVHCMIFAWASKTRGSVGMLANYIIIIIIDIIALIRLLMI